MPNPTAPLFRVSCVINDMNVINMPMNTAGATTKIHPAILHRRLKAEIRLGDSESVAHRSTASTKTPTSDNVVDVVQHLFLAECIRECVLLTPSP